MTKEAAPSLMRNKKPRGTIAPYGVRLSCVVLILSRRRVVAGWLAALLRLPTAEAAAGRGRV